MLTEPTGGRRGAVAGMTRLEAESIGGLRLLKRSAESESAARAVFLECAAKFSPRIEDAMRRVRRSSSVRGRRARLCWTLRARNGCLGRRSSWRSGCARSWQRRDFAPRLR